MADENVTPQQNPEKPTEGTPQPQAQQVPPPAAAGAPKSTKRAEVTHVVIRPLPKIVFLYPSCVAGFIAAIWSGFNPASPWPGLLFMMMLWLNLLILAFDFNRASTVAILLGFTCVALLSLYVGETLGIKIFEMLMDWIKSWDLQANPRFYVAYSGFLLFVFIVVYIRTRFDYWVVTHNELLHYHGILGNVERYPAPNLRVTKEIEDVFEYLLLQSGRLVITPASELRSIILDNVPRIQRVEQRLNELLSKIIVKTTG